MKTYLKLTTSAVLAAIMMTQPLVENSRAAVVVPAKEAGPQAQTQAEDVPQEIEQEIRTLVSQIENGVPSGLLSALTLAGQGAASYKLGTPTYYWFYYPQPQVLIECIVAVIVIVVGGIIIYKIVKFCKQKFNPPPSTNKNSSASISLSAAAKAYGAKTSAGQSDTVYAAWFVIHGDPDAYAIDQNGGSAIISYSVTPTTNGPVAILGNPVLVPVSDGVTRSEFDAALRQWGLDSRSNVCYSVNYAPTSSIPNVHFDAGTKTLTATNNGASYYCDGVLQRATVLNGQTNWASILTVRMSPGQPYQIIDDTAPSDGAFYRIVPKN